MRCACSRFAYPGAGGSGVRAATTAFGAGFGAGSAYGDCQKEVMLMCHWRDNDTVHNESCLRFTFT